MSSQSPHPIYQQYSATPEFLSFIRPFIGCKITENFEKVFLGDNPHSRKKHEECYLYDSSVAKEKSKKHTDFYTRVFDFPSYETPCVKPKDPDDFKENYHALTVQVMFGKIVRFFPPKIGWVSVSEINERTHYLAIDEFRQLRSPDRVDFRMYKAVLDKCTYCGGVKPWKYDYIDCPMIHDSRCAENFRQLPPFGEHTGDIPNWDWLNQFNPDWKLGFDPDEVPF